MQMTPREEAKARNTPEPRSHQINLRLTHSEYKKLSKRSALSGLGRAAYLRMILLEKWRLEERENPILLRLSE